jgi:hypothetical protein
MKLSKAHEANFHTLLEAANNGDLVLLDCAKAENPEEQVATICAITKIPGSDEVGFVPLAMLFNENPYDVLLPPNPDGGYFPLNEEE